MDAPMAHILIVEDEEAHAELIRRGFATHMDRFRLTVVHNLKDARTCLDEALPDLVITDLLLPDGRGTELLPFREEGPPFPMVVMTSFGDERIAVDAIKGGALDYVVKTVTALTDMPHVAERALREWGHIIERRRAEEALRDSEKRYRTLYRDNPSMFFTLDADGKVISVNQFGASQLGYTIDELEGQSVLKVLYEADQPTAVEQLKLCLQNPWQVHRWQFRKVRKDGSLLWVEEFARTVMTPDGVHTVFVVCHDITERKRAEGQIHKLNRTLQVINEVNEALVRATEESELLRRACQTIVDVGGYRLAWVGLAEHDEAKTVRPVTSAGRGEGYLDTVALTWADTERGHSPADAAIRTGQPVVTGNILTDPDDASWRTQALERGYASSIALPLLTNGLAFGAIQIYASEPEAFDTEEVKLLTEMADDLAYGLVALRTRAEHRRAEEQITRLNLDLERRARGLAALNEAGHVMASTLDLDTLLGRIMEQVQSLLEAQAVSVMLVTLTPDKTGEELVFAAATSPGSKNLIGTRLPITAGIAGWVMRQRQAALVVDAQTDLRFYSDIDRMTGMTTRSVLAVPLIVKGSALGVIEAINKATGAFDQHDLDVLEALSNSAAIAVENARLYATEHERAAALARALEQQRELDRLQRQFIQNVSHELRTPLAIVRGHAELLETGWFGELQPDQRESIAIILRRTQMLTRLVDDIVSVLEHEGRELKREPVDLTQLVSTSLTDFQATAQKGGLALSAETAPNLLPVSGDSMALRRALDNLIGNACKFTPTGGRATVRLWQSQGCTHLQVADTGIGVAQEHLERIFERFYQVDGSSTRRYGGIGLGLALIKEIVEAHGGQITVTSELGKGTTFTIVLPTA